MAEATTECFCDPPNDYSGQLRAGDETQLPCYLPQPADDDAAIGGEPMGPLGPWATGRVDWGPLKGLTGTRPVVDRYTITRFSGGEWRDHNAEVMNAAAKTMQGAAMAGFNSRRCMEQTGASIDGNQTGSTKRLGQRAQDVYRWKMELQRGIEAIAEEVNLLERQRQRLKTSMGVMRVPESIAGECLALRTTRLESDLCRDEVEEELVKEVALTYEVRDVMERLLAQMEEQLRCTKAVKQNLEMDWSDKEEGYYLEAENVGLKNDSPTALFRPGATRVPNNQSTPASYEAATRESLRLAEQERARSYELRQLLDCMLTDTARDLRAQADRVESALARNVAVVDQCRQHLENQLVQLLQGVADTEKLIDALKAALRSADQAMKVAQTRLDNRLYRVRIESCRDESQYGLIDEVKSLAESVAALTLQLTGAQDALGRLADGRARLEREILVKRKTLNIDRDRCAEVRSHYPSATALTGY